MRPRFTEYCRSEKIDIEIFYPEYAMKDQLAEELPEPFDIADFEETIANLSRAVILFPEAAGSFAEVGYFSALPDISKKTVLALDSSFQGKDSFISLGPAKKIGNQSSFQPAIQIDYRNPNFKDIIERIDRIKPNGNRKHLVVGRMTETSDYDLVCLVSKAISIMSIATESDINYVFNAIYKGHSSKPRIRKAISILSGASYIKTIGDFGHFYFNEEKPQLLQPKTGFAGEEAAIALELTEKYLNFDADFLSLVEGSRDAS